MSGINLNFDVVNQKGTPAFYSDIFANRPTYGYPGRVFISTDTGAIYEDTGSAWTLIADAGAGTTGTLEQVTTNGNTTTKGISITAGGLSSNSITNTSLTTGSVSFVGASGLMTQDNTNLFWDNTSKYLGIGPTGGPTAPLDIHNGSVNVLMQLNATSTNNSNIAFLNGGVGKWRIGNLYNAGANSFQVYDVLNATARLTILNTGATTLNGALTSTSVAITGGTSAQYLKADGSTSTLTNPVTGTGLATQVALFNGTSTITGSVNLVFDSINGRLGIGSSFTPGYQLDVTGNARITSSITASSFIKDTGTSAQILAGDGSVITAGTNITISGGTISASGGGSGVTSLSAIGSTANANGATITGSVLNLQPASASFGGVITTGTQTFAGAKTFSSITATGVITSNNPAGLVVQPTTTTDQGYFTISNASGNSFFGIDNSAGTVLGNGAYSRFWYNSGAYPLDFYTSATIRTRLTSTGNLLIGTTTDSAQGVLQISGGITGGGISLTGESLSATATLNKGYYHVFTGSTGQTLTLPSPSSNNYQYVIINTTANAVTIAAATSTNIVNLAGTSVASITLIANGRVFLIADGNNKYYQIF